MPTHDVWEQVPINDTDRADLDEAQVIALRDPGDLEARMVMTRTMQRICSQYGYDDRGAGTGMDAQGRTTLSAYRPARLT